MANHAIFLTCVVAVLFGQGVQAFILSFVTNDTVCYRDIDCFSSGGAFREAGRVISVTPESPENISTNFILYTKENAKFGQHLAALQLSDLKTKWTFFKDRQTKLIVHGFIDNWNYLSWIKNMKDEFLKHGDHNVIIVDWSGGNLPPYTQATANTRVVGAQIALLIQKLQSDFNASPSQFQIVGHSLGSHVAGYAGERVPGLGRITGLDPAGPYFAGTDKTVRLDQTDADFVDVIHSDAGSSLLEGYGLLQPLGHLDFYPNLGKDQPGCKPDIIHNLLNLKLADGLVELLSCNHLRSIKYFMESLTTTCPFMAFPCNSAEDFTANKCHSCPKGGCPSMGINADRHKPPAGTPRKYYTTTADSAPFCQYHMFIELKLATTENQEERGTVEVRFHGSKGSSRWIQLDQEAHYHAPGTMYERNIGSTARYGAIEKVEIRFNHESSYTDPSSWNPWGYRSPKLHLEEIHIIKEEQGEEVHLCADGQVMENNEILVVDTHCKH